MNVLRNATLLRSYTQQALPDVQLSIIHFFNFARLPGFAQLT